MAAAAAPGPARGTKARNWTVTWNSKKVADFMAKQNDQTRYLCAQGELAPLTGQPHVQGFIQYINAKNFSYVKNMFPGAHLEIARGTGVENKEYCSKPDSRDPALHAAFQEWGDMADKSNQGKRCDVAELLKGVVTGDVSSEVRRSLRFLTWAARLPLAFSFDS